MVRPAWWEDRRILVSEHPVGIGRERPNRLSTAVADLMDASNRRGRDILRLLAGMTE